MKFFKLLMVFSIVAAFLLPHSAVKASTTGTVVVVFEDPEREDTVRRTLKIYDRDLVVNDVQSVTKLDAYAKKVTSLAGLEYATNLQTLDLNYYLGRPNVKDIKGIGITLGIQVPW